MVGRSSGSIARSRFTRSIPKSFATQWDAFYMHLVVRLTFVADTIKLFIDARDRIALNAT